MPVSIVILPEASVVMNGLKKSGVHGLHRGALVDGQQQEKMAGEGLRQVKVCGVRQDGNCHVDALHAQKMDAVAACEEHWRHKQGLNDALLIFIVTV